MENVPHHLEPVFLDLLEPATGKFSVLTLMSLPLFHNALEVARGKDQQ